MTKEKIDVKQLIYAINDQKDLDINFCMDEGCLLVTDDKKPLIKVINYLFNYMKSISTSALDLGLELLPDKYILNIIAAVNKDVDDINNSISETLEPYSILFDFIHEPMKYAQVKLTFPISA